MPGVSCKALATQNSSEWPCSMCPIPPGSGLWGWGHPIYIFLIFPEHLELWTPLQIPSWGPPLGCTLLQKYMSIHFTFYPVLEISPPLHSMCFLLPPISITNEFHVAPLCVPLWFWCIKLVIKLSFFRSIFSIAWDFTSQQLSSPWLK